jgi:hypothetical protein
MTAMAFLIRRDPAREADTLGTPARLHIELVLAGGNEEFADYIIRWIAWAIQNPQFQTVPGFQLTAPDCSMLRAGG